MVDQGRGQEAADLLPRTRVDDGSRDCRRGEAVSAIPFARSEFGEGAIAAAVDVLRSGWVATGPQVLAFEEEFALAGHRLLVADRVIEKVLSLPLYPQRTDEQLDRTCDAIIEMHHLGPRRRSNQSHASRYRRFGAK